MRTLRDFCREAAITLIAEGIETRKQLDTLRELGVSHGQGFLFGLPSADQPAARRLSAARGRDPQVRSLAAASTPVIQCRAR